MALRTKKDLKKVIPNFNQFVKFISKFREIVDTGNWQNIIAVNYLD